MEETFDKAIADQIDLVFNEHNELRDHRQEFPWLKGSLGCPYSGIWFLAENPSLSKVEQATNPSGGTMTPEAQWYAGWGDKLFREALVNNGFKKSGVHESGGWNCYITNIIKEADYTERRKEKGFKAHTESARIWAPVLHLELQLSSPKLVVVMGRKVEKLIIQLKKENLIQLPRTRFIDHYAYIASRPRGNLGPRHPQRVQEYHDNMVEIRRFFDTLH